MLTSSTNQYLRPEYLTPLPTTLDAKKSPLALLAQTCSQIGVDLPPSKSLLAPPDKSKSSSKTDPSSREKASPLLGHHHHHHHNSTSSASSTSSLESNKSSSFKPYESCIGRDKATSSPEQQRVPSAHSNSGSRSRTPGNGSGKQRCSSNQSASSSGGREMTPHGRKSATPGSNETATRESPRIDPARSSASGSPSQSKPVFSPAVLSSQDYFRPSALSLISSSAASSGATTTTTPSAAAYGLPFPPQFPPMDPMTANSLLSQHHAALKNGLAGNPFLGYARMKTSTGADTLMVPVCRDPYCKGCPLNSHLLGTTAASSPVNGAKLPPTSQATPPSSGPCAAGCTQCDHNNPGGPAQAAAAAAAAAAASPYAAYAQAHFMALAAASQMPYGCNYIGSDGIYCGKRFPNSDELLQHLRSHGPAASESSAAAAAASTAAALSLLTPPGLGPGHPLLSRTYPTPPLSPLAAARYHPYAKPYGASPLAGLGLPLAPPPHPHPGLPPYFSPYASLYANSRLGAASGMHP